MTEMIEPIEIWNLYGFLLLIPSLAICEWNNLHLTSKVDCVVDLVLKSQEYFVSLVSLLNYKLNLEGLT